MNNATPQAPDRRERKLVAELSGLEIELARMENEVRGQDLTVMPAEVVAARRAIARCVGILGSIGDAARVKLEQDIDGGEADALHLLHNDLLSLAHRHEGSYRLAIWSPLG